MSDAPSDLPPSFDPDSIAARLGAEHPATHAGYVSFKGYLAEEQSGVHRLFFDDSFWSWLEVNATDIAARLDVPPNAQDPRSVIWVSRNAKVTKCQVGYAPDLEDEGWGVDVDSTVASRARRRRPPY